MRETQLPLGELANLWVDEPAVPFHIAPTGGGIGTRSRVRFGHGVRDSSVTCVGFDVPRRGAATEPVHPAGTGAQLVIRTRAAGRVR